MNYKRLLYLICFLCVWDIVSAQDRSIRFEEGTFQTALEKAKQENKLLFVDCYTSWCGPCKMLARDVFTNNEVADYFNEHFISLKVDCEKGEGPEIKNRFGVSGYPTLLFINGQGEVVNKIVGASRQPYFLENVKKGLDPKNSLYAKEQKYESGYRDQAFLVDLIANYKKVREDKKATEVSQELLKSVKGDQLLTKEMWDVVSYYFVSPYGSEWCNFILENADKWVDKPVEINVVNAAALSNKLLQFANGAVYDEERNVHEVHNIKIDALKDIIEDSNGKSVLVAWTYQHDRDRIIQALKAYKPRELKTNKDIQDWNNGKVQVMLAHPASAGHGLNLQAGGSIIVWFGQTWSLELYQQFNARLYRQGQQEHVVIHHLILEGTHDEDVIQSLKNKDKKQNSLMDSIKAKIDKYKKFM